MAIIHVMVYANEHFTSQNIWSPLTPHGWANFSKPPDAVHAAQVCLHYDGGALVLPGHSACLHTMFLMQNRATCLITW